MPEQNVANAGDPTFCPAKLVLVVDDDRFFRVQLEAGLSKRFQVITAESGENALAIFNAKNPDLVVMDIEMAGIDGFETCRRIRQSSTVPVIFVTGHHSLEHQMEAFDAGASDTISKPVSIPILLRKAELAIEQHHHYQRLHIEKNDLQTMAMGFLSSVGENGVLMNFVRSSTQCRTLTELAGKISEATRELGMQSFGVIRHAGGEVAFRSEGEPTSLEAAILAKLSTMGRIFQFKKQLVVNYDRVSIAITNVPVDSPDQAGRFRDYLAILAEMAEGLCDNVQMRQESMERGEQLQVALIGAVSAVESLRQKHGAMLTDTRILLQELVDNIERTFGWLGTTTDQEQGINNTMDESVQRILNLLSTSGQYDVEFDGVLTALRGNEGAAEADLW